MLWSLSEHMGKCPEIVTLPSTSRDRMTS